MCTCTMYSRMCSTLHCKFSVTPSEPTEDKVTITVVDSMNNNYVVATTTVDKGSDITSWLNGLGKPTHDGYEFSSYEITAGTITNVTDNATVYLRYTVSGGGSTTNRVTTYVNGDGDICVNAADGGWDFTGSATVAIKMAKAFDSVEYNTFDIMEFDTGEGEQGTKTDAAISGDTITFTDDNITTHSFYRIGLFLNSNRVGQAAWDAGFKPIKVTVTVDETPHEYDVTSNN